MRILEVVSCSGMAEIIEAQVTPRTRHGDLGFQGQIQARLAPPEQSRGTGSEHDWVRRLSLNYHPLYVDSSDESTSQGAESLRKRLGTDG